MLSLFKKPLYFFFGTFLCLNIISILFYSLEENNHVISKTYSLDYELLELVSQLDDMISTTSTNAFTSNKIVGIDEIEQLYFKMTYTQSSLNNNINIRSEIYVEENSFELSDYETRYILIKFISPSKDELTKYINNFEKKSLNIFKENVINKLLAKQIFLSIQESYEVIKNIYYSKYDNETSFLFDSDKLVEKIENVKLINTNIISIEDTHGFQKLVFYILLSSVISLLLTILVLAFYKKVEW